MKDIKAKDIKLLKSLIDTPSPSGFEQNIALLIKNELLNSVSRSRIEVDFQNNVIVNIEGIDRSKTVMIDAHLDEIGFIVTNIDKEGLINIQYIGGGDNSILSARNLVIISDKKKINAVVDRKHAHLVTNEEDEAITKITNAQVDIGIRKRAQVFKHIKIGDPVVYKSSFDKLIGNNYAGYGFDDKSGCFILIETIREIVRSRKKPVCNLIFTFSSQEETYGNKLKSIVLKYKPQLFIETDVTFASDYSEDLESEVGKCCLGKGIVLYRGVDIHNPSLQLLESVARRIKAKTQYQASTGGTGYTQSLMTGYGIRGLILGIPLRNMHTPVEIINTEDLKQGIRLLSSFLLSKRINSILEK